MFNQILDGSFSNVMEDLDEFAEKRIVGYGVTEEDETFYVKCNLYNSDSGRACAAIVYFCNNNGEYSYECEYLDDLDFVPKSKYYEIL